VQGRIFVAKLKYDMKTDILISPEVTALKSEIERLQKEFMRLYTLRDQMINHERDDLYCRYVLLIGNEKFENFKLSVEVQALKMMCEMAQACVNRDDIPDMDDIKRNVDFEMADYYKEVEAQAEAVRLAREASCFSDYDMRELQQLFRLVVKRLHPDLHPDLPEKMLDLFIQAQAAYRTKNLPLLREIVMCLDLNEDVDEVLAKSEVTLQQMRDRLRQQIADLENEIGNLELSFPFNIRKCISDPTWIHEQKEELKREREQLLAQRDMYLERLKIFSDL